MRVVRGALVAVMVLAPAWASAQTINSVSLGDLPNTGGRWQVGEVTLVAPADEVQRWLADSSRWEERFPDDSQVRELGRLPDGRHSVEFHSAALGKTLTVRVHEQSGRIVWDGTGKGVTAQGKIFVEPLAGGRTRVIMQSTGELHGALGKFASQGMKRKRSLKKLGADLHALVRLSNTWAATTRHGG